MIFRFPFRRLGFVLVALLFCTSCAYAERRPGNYSASPSASAEDPLLSVPPAVVSRSENGRIVIRATRLGEPLHVEGRLDESVYSTVPLISDFSHPAGRSIGSLVLRDLRDGWQRG